MTPVPPFLNGSQTRLSVMLTRHASYRAWCIFETRCCFGGIHRTSVIRDRIIPQIPSSHRTHHRNPRFEVVTILHWTPLGADGSPRPYFSEDSDFLCPYGHDKLGRFCSQRV